MDGKGTQISSVLDPIMNEGSNFSGMLTKVKYTYVNKSNGVDGIEILDLRIKKTNIKIIREAIDRMDEEDQKLYKGYWKVGSLVFFEGRNVTSKFIKKLIEVEQENGIDTSLPYEYESMGYKKYAVGGLVRETNKYGYDLEDVPFFTTTLKRYERNYGPGHISDSGKQLTSFTKRELNAGKVKINRRVWYAKINCRYYETDISLRKEIINLNEVWD